jgi:hypothetical protein
VKSVPARQRLHVVGVDEPPILFPDQVFEKDFQ